MSSCTYLRGMTPPPPPPPKSKGKLLVDLPSHVSMISMKICWYRNGTDVMTPIHWKLYLHPYEKLFADLGKCLIWEELDLIIFGKFYFWTQKHLMNLVSLQSKSLFGCWGSFWATLNFYPYTTITHIPPPPTPMNIEKLFWFEQTLSSKNFRFVKCFRKVLPKNDLSFYWSFELGR